MHPQVSVSDQVTAISWSNAAPQPPQSSQDNQQQQQQQELQQGQQTATSASTGGTTADPGAAGIEDNRQEDQVIPSGAGDTQEATKQASLNAEEAPATGRAARRARRQARKHAAAAAHILGGAGGEEGTGEGIPAAYAGRGAKGMRATRTGGSRGQQKRWQVESFVLALDKLLGVGGQPTAAPDGEGGAKDSLPGPQGGRNGGGGSGGGGRPMHVVDFGCGTGGLLLPLAHRYPHAHFTG